MYCIVLYRIVLYCFVECVNVSNGLVYKMKLFLLNMKVEPVKLEILLKCFKWTEPIILFL